MENVKIKTINKHWLLGHFFLFGIPSGLRFYPIIYKCDEYVVELKLYVKDLKEISTMARIFKYTEETNLFNNHKGKFLWEKELPFLQINDNVINITKELDSPKQENIIINLPEILNNIFKLWKEDEKKKEEKSIALEKVKSWNGIIECTN